MADPYPYIGSVALTYPLKWADAGQTIVQGGAVRSRGGEMTVYTCPPAVGSYREIKAVFEWETLENVNTLRQYATTGAVYSADLEGDGTTRSVMFDPRQGGVANVKHQAYGENVVQAHVEDTEMDLYTGELHLIIVA